MSLFNKPGHVTCHADKIIIWVRGKISKNYSYLTLPAGYSVIDAPKPFSK
jgi:hypothetical protein